ncbi:polysaccharide deacetylase family protein [Dechloromonas sp. CZR5]|uniref:polysaccharide deacetylase family protein n=1 Tax=Dechloromonas sp. CZR5 TaxID=2608630 RepID=UPI00123D32B7|nr:polysaccharide deacetylase family protein [Dechloromonas sp. CZR5]
MVEAMFNAVIRRKLNSASNGALTILQYHKVPLCAPKYIEGEVLASDFSWGLEQFKEWFNFLPLEEAIHRLKSHDLPPRSAVLSFDDGYADWFDHVVPALLAHKVPATFFVTSAQLNCSKPFWHERVAVALAKRGVDRLPHGFNFATGTGAEIGLAQTIIAVQNQLKYLPLAEREAAIAVLEADLPLSGDYRPFRSADLIRLRDAGFQIGGHSRHHPILTSCDATQAKDEIGGCKEELEGILREPVTAFAYPNGRPDCDFNASHVALVEAVGYRYAVTTAPGVSRSDTDLFQLPRFTPWARSSWRSALQFLRNMRVSPQMVKV